MHKINCLIFYAIAIASLIVLFKIVTAHGESRLKYPHYLQVNLRINK
ncbi:hypothetical protein [Calothrix sp. PCC 6303]|nr:hypothetical protein [Calothrix sp. PCC 6303]